MFSKTWGGAIARLPPPGYGSVYGHIRRFHEIIISQNGDIITGCYRDCGVGGKISDSRLRAFQNFRPRLPSPSHKVNEVWLITIL